MGNSSSSSSSHEGAATAAVPEHSLLDVELTLVGAKDLAAGDVLELSAALKGHLSSSDAYALIEVEGQKVAWTRPVFDTRAPEWNESFHFKNVHPDAVCKLYLLDKDVGTDDPIGQTQFTAANTDGKETSFELPIEHKGKQAGVIVVRVKSKAVRASTDAKLEQIGPVHYSLHSSLATGFLKGSVTDAASHAINATNTDKAKAAISGSPLDDNALKSVAFHIQLHNIQNYLPHDHEWNHDYAAVQRIFAADHPEAPVLRKAVQTEHALIYKHSSSSTIYGTVSSGAEFMDLIHNGKRLDKRVLFTYAITNTGWYFSETGASFFKDMLSKHMLHSGAAFSVKYAGEFRVERNMIGRHKIVIDNNSGTYAPPKADLPALEKLIESNFPGLSVEALDREDADLQKGRQEILDSWA